MGKAKNFRKQNAGADFSLINLNAAGIDIGADRHWVSVPVDRDSESVRSESLFHCRTICNG
ncbi:MAG: hypothetical protein KME05_10475 [Gloeocapsa sp. UFS-A4-WI-NPMV-4B04]|jgi:ribosomal protein L13E|nr:hypothetical protein [Gloeocapsa sp. UFS-A4-WI-NPMV-4B04]